LGAVNAPTIGRTKHAKGDNQSVETSPAHAIAGHRTQRSPTAWPTRNALVRNVALLTVLTGDYGPRCNSLRGMDCDCIGCIRSPAIIILRTQRTCIHSSTTFEVVSRNLLPDRIAVYSQLRVARVDNASLDNSHPGARVSGSHSAVFTRPPLDFWCCSGNGRFAP